MGKINVGRVLLGGLVAGVVLNIGEYLFNEVLMAEAMRSDLSRLNLQPPGGTFIIRAVGMTFILGIVLVYLYAAIRPRFGAGWKTAVCAGLFAWFFVYLYAGYINFAIGIGSAQPFLIALVWGIIEYCAAAIAGAWVYQETA